MTNAASLGERPGENTDRPRFNFVQWEFSMGSKLVAELVQVLYESKNDAWRDDAAEELARVPDRVEAEAALIEAIQSSAIDDSLRRTCAEALAEIWIKRGFVAESAFSELQGMPRDVVKAFLRTANIPFKE